MTETHEVEIFTGGQGRAYNRWCDTHATGVVLNVKKEGVDVLHESDCPHTYPADPNSVGNKKVCGKIKHVRAWAEENGIEFVWCRTCRG